MVTPTLQAFNTSTYSARLYLTRNGLEAFPPDVPGPSRYSSLKIFLPAITCDFSHRLGDLILQNEERQTYASALETDVKACNILLLLSVTRSRLLPWGPPRVSKHAQAVRLPAASRRVPQKSQIDWAKTHRACAAHPNRSHALESRDPECRAVEEKKQNKKHFHLFHTPQNFKKEALTFFHLTSFNDERSNDLGFKATGCFLYYWYWLTSKAVSNYRLKF